MINCLLCSKQIKLEVGWNLDWLFEQEQYCCHKCLANFEKLSGLLCKVCSKESVSDICEDCASRDHFLDSNKSIYRYNDFAKEYMKKYKFQGDYVIGAIFKNELKKQLAGNKATVIPIPVSDTRKIERGFNQTTGMLKQSNIKYEEILARAHSEKQSKKTKKERLEAKQVFYLSNNSVINHLEVILFDDIYTTGSTLNLAAQILKEAGVKRVTALTIFR